MVILTKNNLEMQLPGNSAHYFSRYTEFECWEWLWIGNFTVLQRKFHSTVLQNT